MNNKNPLSYWNQIQEGIYLRLLEAIEEQAEAQQEIALQLKDINETLKRIAPPQAMSATLKLVANK